MKTRDQIVGACALAAVLIFAAGLVVGWWHIERGPSRLVGEVTPAVARSPASTPTPPGELLSDGKRQIGTAVLLARPSTHADLYLEDGISPSDAQLISRTVDSDVVDVQRTYGRRFSTRALVYVFASTTTYKSGLRAINIDEPRPASFEGVAVALGDRGVVIAWEKVSTEKPITSFRHELTHIMIRQLAKPTRTKTVPAWLNEGSARLEEFTIPGTDWARTWHRYAAASRIAAGDYFALSALRSVADWGVRTGGTAAGAYLDAAAAVQLLRDDIGIAGVIAIFDRMGQGQSFEDAFLEIVGTTVDTFEDSAPSRLERLSAPYPNVVSCACDPGSGDLSFAFYGLAPNTQVALEIVGQTTGVKNTNKTITVDTHGLWRSDLGTEWPADTYTITVTGPRPPGSTAPTASATVRMTAQKVNAGGAK